MKINSRDNQKTELKHTIVSSCPICGSKKYQLYSTRFDDRYGHPDSYELAKCDNCDGFFLLDPVEKDDLPALYEKYYPSLTDFPASKSLLRNFLRQLAPLFSILKQIDKSSTLLSKVPMGSVVLDVGCGYYSDMPQEIRDKRLKWHGLEIDPKVVEVINKTGLQCTLGELTQLKDKNKYEYVLLSQVIEHQMELAKVMKVLNQALKTGGKILVYTPNSDSISSVEPTSSWIHWHTPYHTVIFNKKSITKLAEKHGFIIREYKTFTPTSWELLQRSYLPVKQGQRNTSFVYSFSAVRYLVTSCYLRVRDLLSKDSNPCMYAVLEKVNL